MFQYEYEKRPSSAASCDSRATTTTDWSRGPSTRAFPSDSRALPSVSRPTPSDSRALPNVNRARRPLPPRPIAICERLPVKTTVPLKVWIIASASCFGVCAALVLATIALTKWGSTQTYTTQEIFAQRPEPIYHVPADIPNLTFDDVLKTTSRPKTTIEEATTESGDTEDDLEIPILEKLSMFKNIVANRDNNKKDANLITKPQIHPVHDTTLHHVDRRIEKKDRPKLPEDFDVSELINTDFRNNLEDEAIPQFKPTLPDIFIDRHKGIQLPDAYTNIVGLRKHDIDYYEQYYDDQNLYDDYMQSNSMTNYLIEKVQELHEWITTDKDFDNKNQNSSKKTNSTSEFGQLLKALNESLLEGNVSIIMDKLKDIYFGDNYTISDHNKKPMVNNGTDLLTFGILTLDVMLLHNIQLMAWESQESARNKMLKDPDVFAFNALFMEPNKVEAKQNEVYNNGAFVKRQNLRQESVSDIDIGKTLLENVLEIGMSTARAAIHLGRAYKNTKIVLNQLSNKENLNANIQNQISRNIDGNTHALNHLQISFKNDSSSVANTSGIFYTELDCIWLLYCKNLVATSKLSAPYGLMARINGMALRMLTGELAADRALDTMLYEALTGWKELKCTDMFPKCSKVNAASVVMDSIIQSLKKAQNSNKT